jgi:hypothetical protein
MQLTPPTCTPPPLQHARTACEICGQLGGALRLTVRAIQPHWLYRAPNIDPVINVVDMVEAHETDVIEARIDNRPAEPPPCPTPRVPSRALQVSGEWVHVSCSLYTPELGLMLGLGAEGGGGRPVGVG